MIELVADRLGLGDGGLAQEFNGTLEDYTDFVVAKGPSGTPTKTDKKAERRAAAEARERVRTLQSEAAKLEKALADLTEKRSRIDRAMFDPAAAGPGEKNCTMTEQIGRASCRERVCQYG